MQITDPVQCQIACPLIVPVVSLMHNSRMEERVRWPRRSIPRNESELPTFENHRNATSFFSWMGLLCPGIMEIEMPNACM